MSFVGSGLFPLFTGKFLDGSDDAREDRGHEALAQQDDVDVLYECWADHLVRETNLFFFSIDWDIFFLYALQTIFIF